MNKVRNILWLSKRIKLSLAHFKYYAECLSSSLLSPAVPTPTFAQENIHAISTKELAQAVFGTFKTTTTSRKEEIFLADAALARYAEWYYYYGAENECKQVNRVVAAAQTNNPLFNAYTVRLGEISKDEKLAYQNIIKSHHKFQQESSGAVPQLICRICEQTMPLDKYIVFVFIVTTSLYH